MNYEQYTLIDWMLFFYIYCFIGWCIESTHVSIQSKKLVNRGFMRGPFLPLYGSGATIMLLVTIPVRESLGLTFLFGAIGATILEYFTGVAMEALFKVRYWDYSNQPFNLNGHICLGTTIAWGGLTLLMVKVVHTPVEALVLSIPYQSEGLLVLILTVCIAVDFTLSFKAALDIRDFLAKLTAAREEMEHVQARLDSIIAFSGQKVSQQAGGAKARFSETLQAVKSKLDFLQREEHDESLFHRQICQFRVELEQIKTKYIIGNEYRKILSEHMGFFRKALLKAHPTITSPKFDEALKELKEIVDEHHHQD